MKVNSNQAVNMISQYLLAKLVPLIAGSPGIGKSGIVKSIADNYNLQVIDLRLSQCDPTDLGGFPTIVGEKADYMPMKHFPIKGDPLPKGKNGWLLFLDEITSAPPAIQAASYKLVLDRMVGSHELHDNVAIVCAGNLESDNAVVQPMSTALQSRLVHMELVVDPKQWVEWASSNKLDHRIIDYINFKPGNLYTFKPDHTDNTYACPRTWEFASRVLKNVDIEMDIALPMLAGTISEGVAREFLGFCRIYSNLPRLSDILANPISIPVPVEPAVRYALTGSLAHNTNHSNVANVMQFVTRMPVEFQVIFLREVLRQDHTLKSNPTVIAWISKNATMFM